VGGWIAVLQGLKQDFSGWYRHRTFITALCWQILSVWWCDQ
jgi:hypothetical protein